MMGHEESESDGIHGKYRGAVTEFDQVMRSGKTEQRNT
jgi:hypothetical protein